MVLLIVTPGFEYTAFLPLVRALERDGLAVRSLEFDCAGQTSAEYADEIREVAGAMPSGTVVVAHGFGATLALIADAEVERYVLLGPVLGVVPQPVVADLATLPVSSSVDLGATYAWRTRDTTSVLLGDRSLDLGRVPGPFVAEIQEWIAARDVPVDLPAISQPVWVAVGSLDEVATLEATIPASRSLPDRTLVRLGRNRLDPSDYTHADLLTDPVPLRVAVRAAKGR